MSDAASDAVAKLAGAHQPRPSKPPELVIDPKAADAPLVGDVVEHLRDEFDVEQSHSSDHAQVWTVTPRGGS